MDLERAHATLGVDASSPLKDVGAAYLARAKMLHPDRQGGDAPMRREAERAMSQLTEAWDTVQRAGENRHIPAEARADVGWDPPAELRLPVVGECDLCGSRPAKAVSLRSVTGRLVFFRWMRLEQELCRACATAMYREAHDANALWRITGIGPSCGTSAVFEDLSTGRTYCAVPN